MIALAALAIALNACMFSVLYGLIAKPLPFPVQGRLVSLKLSADKLGLDLGWSIPFLDSASQHNDGLQRVGAFRTSEAALLTDAQRTTGSAGAVIVQPAVFDLLGLNPVAGRLFKESDTLPGMPCHAVVSEDFWAQRFASAFQEGHRMNISGKGCLIVGLLPADSGFPDAARRIWLPMTVSEKDRSAAEAGSFGDIQAIARLAPGRSAEQVTNEMRRRIGSNRSLAWISEQIGASPTAVPLRYLWIGDRLFSLKLMTLAALIVFAVTTANMCNLFALAVLKRQHEFALIEALGARRGRLLAQVLLEALCITTVGAALSVALIMPGLDFLRRAGMLPEDVPQHIGLDAATLAAVACMIVTMAAVMTASAAGMLRQNLADSLRQGGNGQVSSMKGARLRRVLVVAQIACTIVLLFGTVLLIRSSNNLIAEDVGFSGESVYVGQLGMQSRSVQADPAALHTTLAAWLSVVAGAPGVNAVALASTAPFSESASLSTLRLKDAGQGVPEINAYEVLVSHQYFTALGLPLRAGRYFTLHETRSKAQSIIVDTSFVSRYFGAVDPIGRLVSSIGPDGPVDLRIVGVVGAARQRSVRANDEYATFYRPFETPWPVPGLPAESVSVIVASSLPPAPLRASLEQPLQRAPIGLRIQDVTPMPEIIRKTLDAELRLNLMLKLLVGVALALSAVGLYALLAFSVIARTREFGVRMALGADRLHIIRLVGMQGAVLFALASLIALPGALLVGRSLSDKLFGIAPNDPLSLITVLALIALVCALANTIPALHASRVSPMKALRKD